MKKYFIFSVLVIAVMFLSSHHYFGGNDPILPATPYSYQIPYIPDHLEITQYGMTSDTILTFVDDYVSTLGRVLFYDELLSASEDISCGTCHLQKFSFADSLTFSHGVTAPTARNSLHLNDLGWSNQTTYFWDMKISSNFGSFDTLLGNAIQLPLADPNEIGVLDVNTMIQKMSQTNYYPALFYDAYGSSTITEPLIVEALTQFICSMVTFDSRFDQVSSSNGTDSFTPDELIGKGLFQSDCEFCHSDGINNLTTGGPLYAILPAFDNGMKRDSSDLGAGDWNPNFAFSYKIPTLRNIAQTAPYMHDGRFATLDQLINHYSDSIVASSPWIISPGFQYTATEKNQLKAFLKTFTSYNLLTNLKWSDPFPGISTEIKDTEELAITTKIFPNPTSEYATIQFKNEARFMTYLKVFSANGQLMTHRSTHKPQIKIRVADYPAGVYVVKLSQGETEVSKQLVVVK